MPLIYENLANSYPFRSHLSSLEDVKLLVIGSLGVGQGTLVTSWLLVCAGCSLFCASFQFDGCISAFSYVEIRQQSIL